MPRRPSKSKTSFDRVQKFGLKHSQPPTPVDIDVVIRRAVPLLTQLAGTVIEFEVGLDATGTIVASHDDLEQLVTAIVVAGRDLLPVGGALRLETQTSAETLTVSAIASGYGVQSAQSTAALSALAARCGGSSAAPINASRPSSGSPRMEDMMQMRGRFQPTAYSEDGEGSWQIGWNTTCSLEAPPTIRRTISPD